MAIGILFALHSALGYHPYESTLSFMFILYIGLPDVNQLRCTSEA